MNFPRVMKLLIKTQEQCDKVAIEQARLNDLINEVKYIVGQASIKKGQG